MNTTKLLNRTVCIVLVLAIALSALASLVYAYEADATLTASLAEAKSYIDGITVNSSSNDPATVVKNFKTHFTWDNEKRENSKSYLFDWSYYNGVVFEGIEYVYEVTGDTQYKDYVIEYMSSLINSNGSWATCTNNSSKQCAGYNSTHGADCYKTASLLLDAYEMTGDNRYLTMAGTLYADLDSAASKYSLSNAGNNYRHTWATDPSPDLWLDGLYMILPFRAEYAKYIGDTAELDLIVDRMQWVSDNMYNKSKGLFYHAADSATSNSGTYWLRSIGWYAAAIVDIMDSMEGENLEAMQKQLVKLVDGMKACQNTSNGMWLNNMAASKSSTNPYETSGTALVCYAVMKAVNNGWLDESYADMAILAFNGICKEKLNNNNLTDICFKGAPGSSNSTFYDNEGKGLGPFIMFYAEVLRYVNTEEDTPDETIPDETVPEGAVPEETLPDEPLPEETPIYQGSSNLESNGVYVLDTNGINSGEKYLIVLNGKALANNNGVDNNPSVTISGNTITLSNDSQLAWTITKSSGNNYYVVNNGSYLNLSRSGNDPIGSSATVYITGSSTYKFRNTSSSGAYLRYSGSQLWCAGTSNSNNSISLYVRTGGSGEEVVFTLSPSGTELLPGKTLALNGTVTVDGKAVDLRNCTITWSSSNTACATVSGGIITGVSGGSATITATLSAVNGTNLVEDIVLTIPVSVQAHSYTAVVTAPTCTEGGYTTYTCASCGDSYVADYTNALGHDYTSVTVEPTCTESGYTTYTCAGCGDSYVADYTDALGHNYISVTVDPTCTESGYTTYTCTICHDSYIYNETAALGHDYISVTIEATCTEDGYTAHTCNNCGNSYTDGHVSALGHNITSVVTEATCTEGGYTTHTCSICGIVTVDSYTDAIGHSYESVIVDATCTNNGSISSICTVCGDTLTEQIEATGHNYEAATLLPTCTEGGYTNYTCTNCGDTYIGDETTALGHDYHTVTVDATCTEDGSVSTTCVGCGDSTVTTIAAIGHDYSIVTTAPTCTENGYTTHTCNNCGCSYTTDVTEALGHNYHSITVGPSCTEGGYTNYTCANCGASYVSDFVSALGHSHTAVTTEPTCSKDGSVVYTCACGDSYSEIIAALGHNYTSVEQNGVVIHTCGNCGDSYTESVAWIVVGSGYVLDTDGIDVGQEHKYIVVGANSNYALTLSGSTIGAATVTIDGDIIYLDNASAYEFYFVSNRAENNTYLLTQDGTKGVYHMGGNLYYGTDNKGYWYFGSASNGSYQLYDYDNLNWYLNYGYVWGSESVSRFAVSSTARSLRLFKATSSYARLSGKMIQTVCDTDGATLDSILQKLTIQLSNNGSDVSGTVALTTDMLTWNTAFDAEIPGAYTAEVRYNDVYLGTITVNVTSAHNYETILVTPTCTAQGYTEYKCADCGTSIKRDYTDALGHSYSSVESDGYLVYTCDHCGDSFSEVLETDPSYSQVSSISSGNNYVITLYSGGKYYALSHANNTLSVVQITVSDGEITSDVTEDLVWSYSDNKLSYVSNGTTYYLYASSSNYWWGSSTLSLSTTNASTVSFSNNKLKIGSSYLRYRNGSLSLSYSSTTSYIFIED